METACKQTYNFIMLLLLLAVNAGAQPKCKIEYYTTEHGLSHQRLTAIIKDREGFMWFGSWAGINRFDGHNFVSYKSSSGDMSQLKNDRIDQIMEDQSNYLWILSYDRQVYRFDKKKAQFLPLSTIFNQDSGKKIFFNRILSVSNNFTWIQSTENGLFCVPQQNMSKGGFTRFHKELPP